MAWGGGIRSNARNQIDNTARLRNGHCHLISQSLQLIAYDKHRLNKTSFGPEIVQRFPGSKTTDQKKAPTFLRRWALNILLS